MTCKALTISCLVSDTHGSWEWTRGRALHQSITYSRLMFMSTPPPLYNEFWRELWSNQSSDTRWSEFNELNWHLITCIIHFLWQMVHRHPLVTHPKFQKSFSPQERNVNVVLRKIVRSDGFIWHILHMEMVCSPCRLWFLESSTITRFPGSNVQYDLRLASRTRTRRSISLSFSGGNPPDHLLYWIWAIPNFLSLN